jgi:hypothetical protein
MGLQESRTSVSIDLTCPHCLKNKVSVKIGKRNTKYGEVQRYKCKNCGKTFSDRPFKHVTYPPEIIFTAISFYNLGNTKKKVANILQQKFNVDVPIPTIHSWLNRYKDVCTFTVQRKRYKLDPNTVIRSKKLHHVQVYNFKYHQLKLNFAAKNFPNLRNFINEMYIHCPNKVFRSKGPRCSTLRIPFKPRKVTKQNNALKLAGYALQMAKSNRDRHQKIQDFMLINDSATVAIELPVFFNSNELTNKEKSTYGIDFLGTLTGHIDILQVRFNKIHVLDFKPDANKEDLHSAEQVFLYTLALSKRTGIPLSTFTCAYFDNMNYFQFSPVYKTGSN